MTNAKLTKTQQEVLDRAIDHINEARAIDFEAWVIRSGIHKTFDEYFKWMVAWNGREMAEKFVTMDREFYNDTRNGIVTLQANTNTLKALEKKGYIKIIEIGGEWLDKVEVLGM
jgi:hypothetical protein